MEQELAKLRQRLLAAQEKLKIEREVENNIVLPQSIMYQLFSLKVRIMAEAENKTIRKNVLQQKINCTLTRTI